MRPALTHRFACCLVAWLWVAGLAWAEETRLPLFDAHIHYSQDVWAELSPADAVRRLRAAGIVRALVSSTDDEGTQRLYQADPALVIPALRPYRKPGTLRSWMHDQTVIPYLKARLAKYRYVAIGELHLEGKDAETPVMREVVRLAKQHKLMLHMHADADAIQRIFRQDPDAQILWAHAGFEYAYVVRALLEQHPELWADLSFRREIYLNDRFLPDWRELLIDHADRFLLGVDTYTPERWQQLAAIVRWERELLSALPQAVARKIAHENGQRIFAAWPK